LWPALAVLILQGAALLVSVTPSIDNTTRFLFMMAGPAVCLLLFLVWLLLASRMRWLERVYYAASALGLGVAASRLVHDSMWSTLWFYGVPLTMTAITAGLLVGRSWRTSTRAGLVTAVLVAVWVPFGLVRLEGVDGSFHPEFSWRWAESAEPPMAATVSPQARDAWQVSGVEWPGFRGPAGDGRANDFGAALDWQTARPSEGWRVPIGPGWSSFAFVSGRLFTQEQRGDRELVTCYDADNGSLIWQFAHPNRFSDIVSGAGPRATPTFADGRLYTYGATAVLSCLDATTGTLVWQRDLMKEVNAPLPVWGFTNSPLVIGRVVIVYPGGDGEQGLVAYETASGDPAWQIPSHGMNFSSAQRVTLSERDLVLFGDDTGLLALEPATGKLAWKYRPADWQGPAICQPQQVGDSSLIVPLGDGVGLARLEVRQDGTTWNVTERWSSRNLRPSFNDFVYFQNHCYGFDRNIFCCIDAETGERKWKSGRYGFGQALLLPRVGRLIVTTEGGEAVLLAADPERHREFGRVRALEGKTWNHPVVAGNRLFMRNGKEAVCLELVSRR
jgi:outer membrane protein assembly factor BamB